MHPDLSKLTNKELEAYQFLNTHQQQVSYMSLRDIANQTHILTTQNMEEYFKTMETRIKNYNLELFMQQIKRYMESQK